MEASKTGGQLPPLFVRLAWQRHSAGPFPDIASYLPFGRALLNSCDVCSLISLDRRAQYSASLPQRDVYRWSRPSSTHEWCYCRRTGLCLCAIPGIQSGA